MGALSNAPASRHPLLSPGWILAHTAVIALAVGFVMLGLWQLDRHHERSEANRVGRERLAMPAVPLAEILGMDPSSIRYRAVTATGEFRPADEVLIRSQVHLGGAGFHVITPLVLPDGTAVLVNRGWVPLTLDRPPVAEAAPPEGVVTTTGWVEESQIRPALGPADPDSGRLETMNRVDIDRISEQVPYALAPVYIVAVGEGDQLPASIRPPRFDDAGPHLGYTIQWFGFAVVGLVGYVFLTRRRMRQSRARSATTS